jgi:hypothetical protein
LSTTDKIAADIITSLSKNAPERSKLQYDDNYLWITQAEEHKLVVGSQARILYSDANVSQRLSSLTDIRAEQLLPWRSTKLLLKET